MSGSANLGRAILEIGADDSEYDKTLDQSKSKGKKFVDDTQAAFKELKIHIEDDSGGAFKSVFKNLGDLKSHLGDAVKGFTMGLGGKALDFGIDTFKGFLEGAAQSNEASSKLAAQLGLTKQEADNLASVGRSIYADNWGESLADVNEALATTKNNFKDLNDTDLKHLTEQGLIVKDVFDQDINQTMKTASTIANNFGVDGSTAMDLITKAFQMGGNKADDLLDTFNEYSIQFKNMGFDAKEFGNILINGLDNGAFNADKVADAVKEFNIRIRDGSKQSAEALTGLGLDADEFARKLGDGSMTGKEAMLKVNEALRNTKDEVKRNQLGVMLYGTQWEDMGSKVILALDQGQDKLGEFKGATDAAGAAASTSLGATWNGFLRQLTGALEPLATGLLNIANAVLPPLTQGLSFVIGLIQPFAQWLAQIGQTVGQAVGPALMDTYNTLSTLLGPAVQAVGGFFSGPFLQGIMTVWNFLAATLGPAFSEVAATIDDPVMKVFGMLAGLLSGVVVEGFKAVWTILNATVMPLFNGVVTFITGTFTNTWNDLSTLLSTVWTSIQTTIQNAWQVIEGIFNIIKGVLSGDFAGAWHGIEQLIGAVWSQIQNAISTAWGIIQGVFNVIIGFIGGAFQGAWDGLKKGISGVWDGITSLISGAWDTIKGTFDKITGFLSGAFQQAWDALSTNIKNVWDKITSGIGEAVSAVINKIGEIVSEVGKIPGKALDALGDIGKTLWNAGASLIKGFIDGILSIHIPTPHVDVGFKDTEGPFGIKVPLPYFNVYWTALGGIFDAASIIGVGEAGPEAVIPLDKIKPLFAEALEQIVLPKLGANVPATRQLTAPGYDRMIGRDPAWSGAGDIYNDIKQYILHLTTTQPETSVIEDFELLKARAL